MNNKKIKGNIFILTTVLLTLLLTSCSDTNASGNGSDISKGASSNTQSDIINSKDYTMPKLETLNITKGLEKSEFGDTINNSTTSGITPILDSYCMYDKVYITLDKKSYKIDNPVLNITLHNETDDYVYGNFNFQLEVLLDGEWYIIPPVNYWIIDLASESPKGEYTDEIDLSEIDVNYIDGDYRIIKIYNTEKVDKKIITYSNFKLSK